jgi:hypothetical protein
MCSLYISGKIIPLHHMTTHNKAHCNKPCTAYGIVFSEIGALICFHHKNFSLHIVLTQYQSAVALSEYHIIPEFVRHLYKGLVTALLPDFSEIWFLSVKS